MAETALPVRGPNLGFAAPRAGATRPNPEGMSARVRSRGRPRRVALVAVWPPLSRVKANGWKGKSSWPGWLTGQHPARRTTVVVAHPFPCSGPFQEVQNRVDPRPHPRTPPRPRLPAPPPSPQLAFASAGPARRPAGAARAELGYCDAVLARELPDGTLELIDGHLRCSTTPDT